MLQTLVLAVSLIAAPAVADTAMQFRVAPHSTINDVTRIVSDNGEYEVFASGEIDSGTTDRFLEFLRKNAIDDATIFFDSPGGSLPEGIKLGKTIRAMRFDTAIGSYGPEGRRAFQGMCASSCAYAFAGGIYRFYNGDEERLGVHQFYSSGDNQGDIGDTQLISSVLIDYLQSMGVDPKAFVVASSTPGDSIFWLTVADANSLGLSNNGADPTTAEIKMVGLSPYLKIEQGRNNVMARVLFGCNSNKVRIVAGIVTTPDLSRDKRSTLVRSYLETPKNGELLVQRGDSGTSAVDSVLWIDRLPGSSDLLKIIKADELGIWTENGGAMRWGATIDLRPAREKMLYFSQNCLSSKH